MTTASTTLHHAVCPWVWPTRQLQPHLKDPAHIKTSARANLTASVWRLSYAAVTLNKISGGRAITGVRKCHNVKGKQRKCQNVFLFRTDIWEGIVQILFHQLLRWQQNGIWLEVLRKHYCFTFCTKPNSQLNRKLWMHLHQSSQNSS